jgi:hypothetical protein
MNANVLAAHLADSGLVLIGSAVLEDWQQPAIAPLQFVEAADEGRFEGDECYCCCCTGECRWSDYDADMDAEELEAAGFALEQEMDVVVNAWHRVKFWVDGGSDLSGEV